MVTKKKIRKNRLEFNIKKTSFFTNMYNTVAYIPLKRNEDYKNLEINIKSYNDSVGAGLLKYNNELKVKPFVKDCPFTHLKDTLDIEKIYVNKTKMLVETIERAIKDLSPFGFCFEDEYYICDNPKVPIGILVRNTNELMICIIAPCIDSEDFVNSVNKEIEKEK